MPRDLLQEAPKDLLASGETPSQPSKSPMRQSLESTGSSMLHNFVPGSELAEFGFKNEELLPLLGQLGGGFAGSRVGMGFQGSVGGATAGNILKQQIGILKGKQDSFDLTDTAKEAALTGLTEGLFRLPAFIAFRKLRASAELGGGLKVDQALMKGQLSKVKDAVPIDDVLTPLQEGMDKIAVKSGPQAAQLNKWMILLNKMKTGGQTHVDGRTMIQMEEQLGEVAKFKNPSVFGIEIPTHVPNKAANVLAKEMRNKVSGSVDNFAESQGLSSWKTNSKRISELLKVVGEKSGSGIRRSFLEGLAGGATGMMTKSPAIGIGTTIALEAFTNPGSRALAFKGLEKTGLGRAATLAGTEVVRQGLDD